MACLRSIETLLRPAPSPTLRCWLLWRSQTMRENRKIIPKSRCRSTHNKRRKTMPLKLGEWLNNRLQKRKNEGATNYLPTIANNHHGSACRVSTSGVCVCHPSSSRYCTELLCISQLRAKIAPMISALFLSHRIVFAQSRNSVPFRPVPNSPPQFTPHKHQIKRRKETELSKIRRISCQILIRENIFVNIKCLIE